MRLRPLAAEPRGARFGARAAARRRQGRRFHPTGAVKPARIGDSFPTNAGRFQRFSGVRWAFRGPAAQNSGSPATAAGVRFQQSLHMNYYAKFLLKTKHYVLHMMRTCFTVYMSGRRVADHRTTPIIHV